MTLFLDEIRRLDCTDDILAVAGLAGVGHDEELHNDVVDVGGRRLENVDVLSAHTLLYVHHRLPKVNKKNLCFSRVVDPYLHGPAIGIHLAMRIHMTSFLCLS
jgi:hypothetical protein